MGLAPEYEEKHYDGAEKRGRLLPIATPDGRDGTLQIHQDVTLYAGILDGDDHVAHTLAPRRYAYLHVALGSVEVNVQHLGAGDGAMIDDREIHLEHGQSAELLLFDLA
jgi:redox-sensitive bicupin YhaK (pirin superfamily)